MTRAGFDDGGRFDDVRATLGGREPAVASLDTISAASFADREIPERRWLVRDVLPERNVATLSGDGGLGKSLLGVQLGVAVATGTDWIGWITQAGPVLYLSAEDEEDEVHRRLADIVASRGMSLADLADFHLACLAGADATLAIPEGRAGPMAPTPLFRGLEAQVAKLRPRLVIVDNLADVFGGDEISRPQARSFIGMLRTLAVTFDLTVLIIAHPSLTGLSSGSGLSGSTAWNNSVRARLYLDRAKASEGEPPDPDARVLRNVKANYAATGAEVRLRWTKGVLRLEGSTGGSALDRAAAAAEAQDRFLLLLDRLKKQGRDVSHKPSQTYAPKVFSREPDCTSLTSKMLERAMATLFARDEIFVEVFGPPSKARSRIRRRTI